MKLKYNYFIFSLLLAFVACKPEIDISKPGSSNNVDFSKYIAVGNSLTAGFSNGGLYLGGQKVAYPNLMAEQMKAVGGGVFNSPFFDESHANGSGYLYLKALPTPTSPEIAPVTDKLAYRDQNGHLDKYTGEIENLGIPGMRVDLAFYAPFSALNNYFERLLPDAEVGVTTYFQFIQGRHHTFFSLWLGNNDVLGYATSGGVVSGATSQLTDKQTFYALYNNLLNALTAGGQKGVVGTLPDVTAIPYFNTVTVAALLQAAQQINPQAQAIFIQAINDDGVVVTRPATSQDLIVLPFQSTGLFGKPNAQGYPYGLHPLNPIQNQYVLDTNEVILTKSYVDSYNQTIKSLADAKGLAVADMHAFLNDVKKGIVVEGVNINASFISGGAFSLDGVHLTPRGYALVGNVFLKAINAKYNSTVPLIDVAAYQGVQFPAQ